MEEAVLSTDLARQLSQAVNGDALIVMPLPVSDPGGTRAVHFVLLGGTDEVIESLKPKNLSSQNLNEFLAFQFSLITDPRTSGRSVQKTFGCFNEVMGA